MHACARDRDIERQSKRETERAHAREEEKKREGLEFTRGAEAPAGPLAKRDLVLDEGFYIFSPH